MSVRNRKSAKGCLQLVDEIGLLPRETAVRIRVTAEMAVGGGAGIDRPVQLQMRADAARRQVHGLADRVRDVLVPGLAGAVGLDIHRSEEHTSELQSLMRISYAVFCLKKKK